MPQKIQGQSQTGKMHVLTNMSSIVAWFHLEYWGGIQCNMVYVKLGASEPQNSRSMHKGIDQCTSLVKLVQKGQIKISIYYVGCLSTLTGQTWSLLRQVFAGLRKTRIQEIMPNLLCLPYKIILLSSFSYLKNYVDFFSSLEYFLPFLATCLNLFTLLACLVIFLTLFG